jgi:solute carrier family 25 iron transporter 28/37
MQILSASPAATYTGVAQAMSRISSVEGARTLWRGVASVIMGAGPAHAVYFGTYEAVKDMTGGNERGHQFASTGETPSAGSLGFFRC